LSKYIINSTVLRTAKVTKSYLRNVTLPTSQSSATVMMSPANQLYNIYYGSSVSIIS